MKIALILLSPRKNGASRRLLRDYVERPLARKAQCVDYFYCGSRNGDPPPDLSAYDRIVLSAPVYIKALPSEGIDFLRKAEDSNRKTGTPLVYFISNCGFLEEENHAVSIAMIRAWCGRCGFCYAYSLGIGSGTRLYPFNGEGGASAPVQRSLPVRFFLRLISYDCGLPDRVLYKCGYKKTLKRFAGDIGAGVAGEDRFIRPFFPKTVVLNNVITNLFFLLKMRTGG